MEARWRRGRRRSGGDGERAGTTGAADAASTPRRAGPSSPSPIAGARAGSTRTGCCCATASGTCSAATTGTTSCARTASTGSAATCRSSARTEPSSVPPGSIRATCSRPNAKQFGVVVDKSVTARVRIAPERAALRRARGRQRPGRRPAAQRGDRGRRAGQQPGGVRVVGARSHRPRRGAVAESRREAFVARLRRAARAGCRRRRRRTR